MYEETRQAEVEGEPIEWQEQRLVVRSFKHVKRQQKALDARLDQGQGGHRRTQREGTGAQSFRKL